MKDTILGIDIGTSSIKCCLFSLKGKELFLSSSQYDLLNPSAGVFEIDTSELWDATVKAVRDIIYQVSSTHGSRYGNKYKIIAAGVCAMMIMPVLMDKNKDVIRPIIHWFDERLQKQYYKLKNLGKDRIIAEFSGSSLTGESTVNALDLIKETESENYDKIAKFLMIKDFIRYKLTGNVLSDFGDASGTQMLDTRKWKWAADAIEELGFNRTFFPELARPSDVGGYITKEAAGITGLPEGIPVAVGSGDGITTIFGLGTNKDGQTGLIIGSAGVFATAASIFPKDNNLRTYICCHPFCDRWYSMLATASSGATLKWYLNSILKNEYLSFSDLDKEASKVSPGSDGLLFLPYLLGSRNPHSNPKATGVLMGLRYKHERSHITRAVFEGIAFEILDILKAQEEILSGNKLKISEIKVAGGITNSTFWMQMAADILQKDLIITNVKELGALGSAIFAAVASGVYNDLEEATSRMVKNKKTVSANGELKAIYDSKFDKFRDIYLTLKDKFEVY
jgi:xylulokinase